jgi:hypothetical protein
MLYCLVLSANTHDIAIAVENGDLETVKIFLEQDPKLANTFDKYGNSLLHRAVAKRNTAIVNLLIKHGADLYRVRKVDGKYTKREKLDEINTGAFEIGPYIAPDGSFIIFESNRPGGKGEIDFYICSRNSDDSWSEAINPGNTINTEDSERFPGISPDGKFLFYLGHTMDIYWVDAKVIEALKPKNLN